MSVRTLWGLIGPKGDQGDPGPSNNVQMGSVSTLASGTPAWATMSGSPPNQTINFGIPQGPAGPAGSNGTNGTNGANGAGYLPGTPAVQTLAFGTAYQAPDTTKSALVSVMIEAGYSITLAGVQADEVGLYVGPTNTTPTLAASFKTSLTGIAISIGMGQISRNQLIALIPPSWYFAIKRITGTTAVIQGAMVQPLS